MKWTTLLIDKICLVRKAHWDRDLKIWASLLLAHLAYRHTSKSGEEGPILIASTLTFKVWKASLKIRFCSPQSIQSINRIRKCKWKTVSALNFLASTWTKSIYIKRVWVWALATRPSVLNSNRAEQVQADMTDQ